jgi:hypothetical protein
MKQILIIIIFFIAVQEIQAQNITDVFQNYQTFEPGNASKLFLRVENMNFVKNNEYKSCNTAGYTLLGTFFRPQVSYYYSKEIRLSLGINLLKYSGQHNFNEITPYLSAIYSPNKTHTIIFGNLNNNRNHGLEEYAYLSEKYYTNAPETGFQYIYNTEKFYIDTWLNWETFIERNDPYQEEFSYGFNSKANLIKIKNNGMISFPLSGLFKHTGGEIDKSDKPVSTIFYLSPGTEFTQKYHKYNFVKEFTLGFYYIALGNRLREERPGPMVTSNFYTKASVKTQYGNLTLAYSLFDNYFNPNGLDIFWSVSSFDPDYHQKIRRLAIVKYCFKYNIDSDILIGGGIDNYIDINEHKYNFSTSIFLVINSNFFIKKFKR